ncbi:hypothetical protein AAC387_Pa08g2312 [Persea americana]
MVGSSFNHGSWKRGFEISEKNFKDYGRRKIPQKIFANLVGFLCLHFYRRYKSGSRQKLGIGITLFGHQPDLEGFEPDLIIMDHGQKEYLGSTLWCVWFVLKVSGARILILELGPIQEGPIELNLCDSPELGPLPNPLILAVSAASITSSACAQMQYPPECCRSPPPIQSEPFG